MHDIDENDGDGEECVSGVVVPEFISYYFVIVREPKVSLEWRKREQELPGAEEVVMAKSIVDDVDSIFRTVQTFLNVYRCRRCKKWCKE